LENIRVARAVGISMLALVTGALKPPVVAHAATFAKAA